MASRNRIVLNRVRLVALAAFFLVASPFAAAETPSAKAPDKAPSEK